MPTREVHRAPPVDVAQLHMLAHPRHKREGARAEHHGAAAAVERIERGQTEEEMGMGGLR